MPESEHDWFISRALEEAGKYLPVGSRKIKEKNGFLFFDDSLSPYIEPEKRRCRYATISIPRPRSQIPLPLSRRRIVIGLEYPAKVGNGEAFPSGVLNYEIEYFQKVYGHPEISLKFDLAESILSGGFLTTITSCDHRDIAEIYSNPSFRRMNPHHDIKPVRLEQGIQIFFKSLLSGVPAASG